MMRRGTSEPSSDSSSEGSTQRQLLKDVAGVPSSIATRVKNRLERRYVELVPRHIRELAEANDVPTPNRYVPAAEAEPIRYPEDGKVYIGVELFYADPVDGGRH